MSAVISRCEASAGLERGDGAAEIGFARRDDRTVLAHLYQRTPCRVLFPNAPPGDVPLATLLTTSGGLTGGDRLRIAVAVGEAAAALVTTAAAEKLYRSLGPETKIGVTLEAGENAWLEFLPQETILFDGARLERRSTVTLAPGARVLATEMVVFGRAAHGERFARGLLHEGWRVYAGTQLIWTDALRLDGDIAATLDRPWAFGGATAHATVILAGADAAAQLELARAVAESAPCRSAATVVNGVLLARFLGPDAALVRRAVMRYVTTLRQETAGLPATMPRSWST